MRRWTRSLAAQLTAALLTLFILGAGAVGFTLYELELRKHDYVILNLTGQLRVLAQNITHDAERLPAEPTAQQSARFFADLAEPMALYQRIVSSLRARLLEPELTGRADPLRCNWDERAIGALDHTAESWERLRAGLDPLIVEGRSGAPAAAYLRLQREPLDDISRDLTRAFQEMMEGKMALVMLINQVMLGLTLATVVLILWLLRRRFLAPLALTLHGFERVAKGEFGHQVTVERHDELGRMGEAFNHLSRRLSALFRLTGRISEAQSLDESLAFVFEEFRDLLPIDWVGLLTLDETGEAFTLERLYSDGPTTLTEGTRYHAEGSLLGVAMGRREPLHLPDVGETAATNPDARFAGALGQDDKHSALFFPLSNERRWGAVLVFASRRPAAYRADHLELLGNIAGQISQGFEKTVVTENLVVSAVSGLAKLAESRDPETGDHLERMSRYSAVIAEEMNREGPHQGEIPPAMVRDILRFAPMHDIGKVGIEDSILLKPGRLDEAERREMERHPTIGGDVLRRSEEQMNAVGHSVFAIGIEIAEGHHEKWNGKGYPRGLAGEEIPLSARIVAAADVFDALTSKRPYKEAWPVEKALKVMNEEAGMHFDPETIAAMNRALPRMMEIYDRHKHV